MESYATIVGSIVLAQPAHHIELPVPAEVIGLGSFVLLTVLLLITLAIGRGRPHS
ncbi:hypothetical protein ABN028_09455 [Actinopolymorpha sp. B17G11]|jgi:hypothetical protein|uniref:hypothetical protein n=1 Tax=unclassified Actinopolymorpha TaxID=2627063 RepID=UPI0032D97815